MKLCLILFMIFAMASCSSLTSNSALTNRYPAEQIQSCNDLVKNIFSAKSYEKNLNRALAKKELITFTEKKALIKYPSIDWINKVKKSFANTLRNWNNNRYPAFYIYNDEDALAIIKKNIQSLESNEFPEAETSVNNWLTSFQNYSKELDLLLEERISLQYNINLLKKIELKTDAPYDVQITLRKNGEYINQVFTLRKNDKNLDFVIKQFKNEMKELDGGLASNGKIKDRIIRQAMLLEMLTIYHRELEHSLKNAPAPSQIALQKLQDLTQILSQKEFSPSSYGIYKVTNKVFARELLATTKLDKLYYKIKEPLLNLKSFAADFFKGNGKNDKEEIGIFKKLYLKISSITPKQIAIGGGTATIGAIGFDRYFYIKNSGNVEVVEPDIQNQITEDDLAHEEQVKRTEETEIEKQTAYSENIDVQVEELIDP